MRILGIDPGSHFTGWGIIDTSLGKFTHIASGVIATKTTHALPLRLQTIADYLDQILRDYHPSIAAVENIFCAQNNQSALKLGQARGVALLCLARFNVQIFEYTALQIKQATTGRGQATKEQVHQMICLLLGLKPETKMRLDASDALAAAICHAQHSTSFTTKLQLREAHVR